MRFAIALTVALVILTSPIVCVAVACDLAKPAHDCCPKSNTMTACPYDILASAKATQAPAAIATLPVTGLVVAAPIYAVADYFGIPAGIVCISPQHRVLRI